MFALDEDEVRWSWFVVIHLVYIRRPFPKSRGKQWRMLCACCSWRRLDRSLYITLNL